MRPVRRALLLLTVSLLAFASTGHTQETVGRAAVIVKTVHGQLLQVLRQLAAKDDVHLDEMISTMPESASELVFFDGTTLSIGENSNLALTKFVYDPRPNAAQFAINALKGGFRFLTGAFNKSAYDIATPTATIGVRGTDFDTQFDEDRTDVRVHSGLVILGDKQGNKHEVRPGETGSIDRAGKFSQDLPFNSPRFASLDKLQTLLREARLENGSPSLGIPHALAFTGLSGFSPSGSQLDSDRSGAANGGAAGGGNTITNSQTQPTNNSQTESVNNVVANPQIEQANNVFVNPQIERTNNLFINFLVEPTNKVSPTTLE